MLGMSEMISRQVEAKSIPNAAKGFALTFAAEPFDHDLELTWVPSNNVAKLTDIAYIALAGFGDWYRGRQLSSPGASSDGLDRQSRLQSVVFSRSGQTLRAANNRAKEIFGPRRLSTGMLHASRARE